jgi:hypothetical protein
MVSALPGEDTMASNRFLQGAAHRRLPVLLLVFGALAGCALHWPWKSHGTHGPAPVQVVGVEPSAAGIQQYWDGTALLLDLTTQGGEGGATLSAPAGGRWPVRMEFRVQPGRIARLEVLAGERTQFEVPALGAAVVLRVRLDGYRGDTPQISLHWHAADDSAR